ncbi:hypothetical protein MHK_010802 [Candidatus Magnetomorum sp. HK-1]|nr:hypothetical protein MHK_010802 [Candidatus Magnetomorum sp. HK-1]
MNLKKNEHIITRNNTKYKYNICVKVTQNNTVVQSKNIKINYPFHPNFGQFLKVVYETNCPEPCYLCVVNDTNYRSIPKWMTDPLLTTASITNQPIIDPFYLLKSIPLIEDVLQSINKSIMFNHSSNQKEVKHATKPTHSTISQSESMLEADGANN